MHSHQHNHQRGFSFIELTVAIVILGALFVAALKGTILIDSMRAIVAIHQIQNYQDRVQVYRSDYHQLPGDDEQAPRRFSREGAIVSKDGIEYTALGNGRIDGKLFNVLGVNGEQFMAWRDLRFAGLVSGDPQLKGASAMPENPWSGFYGFDEGNLGQTDGSLCLTRVPGGAAETIDKKLDDGVINTGRIVATSKYDPPGAFNHFDAPDSEPYNVDKEYIICAPIMP